MSVLNLPQLRFGVSAGTPIRYHGRTFPFSKQNQKLGGFVGLHYGLVTI
jgi:hypothetical protein